MISVQTGGKDVLDSKTFIALGLGETSVRLGDGQEALSFIFDFYEDDKGEQKIEFESVNDKTLRIKLTNWSSPFGVTFAELLEVGQFNKRKLYLLPHVKKIGSKNQFREVLVTAYLGEAIQDG